MKKTYFLTALFVAIGLLVFLSCSRDAVKLDVQPAPVPLAAEQQAYKDFAVILSKAVYNEPELRAFLKREALKQFDYDYDVFYPWTKDSIVDGERSLKEILSEYDIDSRLDIIEKVLPLLTILVPDWSWIDMNCFSVKTWDVETDNVRVCYNIGTRASLIMNGTPAEELSIKQFPSFPVLILKNSERIKQNIDSRGENESYSFAHPDFRNDYIPSKSDIVGYVQEATNMIVGLPLVYSGRLSDVYEETNGVDGLKQRDYIYYGMTASRDTGIISYNYMERLYCMKICNIGSRFLYDESNYDWQDDYLEYTETSQLGFSDLRFKMWKDGNLDLYFYISQGGENQTKVSSVNFSDVFAVKRVHHETVSSGGEDYELYTVDNDCFVMKWFYLHFDLFTWDIRDYPNSYKVSIVEYDSSDTVITITEQETLTFMQNYSTSSESGNGNNSSNNGDSGSTSSNLTHKEGYNEGNTETQQVVKTTTYTLSQSSDDLGSFIVHYSDRILLANPTDLNTQMNTPVVVYTTGIVDVVVMPKYIY